MYDPTTRRVLIDELQAPQCLDHFMFYPPALNMITNSEALIMRKPNVNASDDSLYYLEEPVTGIQVL